MAVSFEGLGKESDPEMDWIKDEIAECARKLMNQGCTPRWVGISMFLVSLELSLELRTGDHLDLIETMFETMKTVRELPLNPH